MSEPAVDRDRLRFWWAAPALAILIMLGGWIWSDRPRFEIADTPVDTRFVTSPRAQLIEIDASGEDVALSVDWRSSHDGRIRYSEVDLLVNGAGPTFVTRDPAIGEWAAARGDGFVLPAGRVREGDVILVGGAEGLDEGEVRLMVDPCDCTAARRTL